MSAPQELKGPDFAAGVDDSRLNDGEPLLGHAAGEPIMLVKREGEVCAVGAVCTHYGGPLAEGIVEGGTIRCPWHHARLDPLLSGRAAGWTRACPGTSRAAKGRAICRPGERYHRRSWRGRQRLRGGVAAAGIRGPDHHVR